MTAKRAKNPSDARKLLPEIGPQAFEHPLDRAALSALQKVPGLDWVVKTLFGFIGEKRLRLFFLGSAVRVNERQFPRIKKLYDEACRTLDIAEPPELFVTQRLWVNAAALGMNKPFIIVTSPLVDMLDDRELQCVLGHELGHVMCGHALYTTLLIILINAWYAFIGIPGGMFALIAIRLALLEWSRKAELSADRAGLLVSQNPDVSYRVDMKLAGGREGEEMSVDEFFRQAEEYEAGGDLLDGILKVALLLGQTHPLPVLRVTELRKWLDSGAYERIMGGDYAKRSDAREDDFVENVKATASAYKESFDSAKDPLIATLKDLGIGAMAAGNELFDFLKKAATPPRDDGPRPTDKQGREGRRKE
jgi:Zn-dependent protease with chaperone function